MNLAICLSLLCSPPPQTQGPAEPARYVSGEAVVRTGYGLDLDTGGVFRGQRTPQGARCEFAWTMTSAKAPMSAFKVPHKPAAGVVMPGASAAPIYRVQTDGGLLAFVQVVHRRQVAVVRFVVRVDGDGEVLPAPTDPFCVGGQGQIAVHFRGDRRFARYRIERRTGVDGKFHPAADTTESQLVDRGLDGGTRYGYRIRGIADNGDEGIPVVVQGTTASCGVRTGRIEFGRKRIDIDLLTGAKTEPGTGDLWIYRRQLQDWEGFHRAPRFDGPKRSSFWDSYGGPTSSSYPFFVRVRGGGVAFCKLEWDQTQGLGAFSFAVNPDGEQLPASPALRRVDGSADQGSVVLNVEAPENWEVQTITARDLNSGIERVLPCRNRVSIDRQATPGQMIEYRAHAVDAHQRRSRVRRLFVAMRPSGIRSGTFQFHYQQGFSFRLEKVCPQHQADVVFANCAGGLLSVTLQSHRAIANLQKLDSKLRGTTSELFARLQAIDPQRCQRFDAVRSAWSQSQHGSSDVFVLRTRLGGWVKLAIVARAAQGGNWQKMPVTVKWVHNPDAPVFTKGKEPVFSKAGLAFGEAVAVGGGPGVKVQKIPGRAKADSVAVSPETAKRQEILLDRGKHKSYQHATFSFEKATRDDTRLANNDWDVLVSHEKFHVRTVADDISTIAALGTVAWKNLAPQHLIGMHREVSIKVQKNHVYLVHTVDRESDHYVLFRVTGVVPGDRYTISWIALLDGRLAHSPDFPKDRGTRAKIKAVLGQLESGGVRSGIGRYYTQRVWRTLWKPLTGAVETTKGYRAFFDDLAKRLDVDIVVDEKVAKVRSKLPRLDRARTWFELLDEAARHARLHWFIDGQGRIAVVRDQQ